MSRQIAPATAGDLAKVDLAVMHLRLARSLLREAAANKAADRVRGALKSAEGAQRHALHRYRRTENSNADL